MSGEEVGLGKIVTRRELLTAVKNWRAMGLKVAFTNGVFDLELHPGHIFSLTEAKKLADRLVVGVNSDASARRLGKGPGRPRYDQVTRARNVAAQPMVDLVVIFEEDTPWELLRRLRPDFLVKGGDYRLSEVVGREFAGEVRLVPRLEGYSTSALDIERYGSPKK